MAATTADFATDASTLWLNTLQVIDPKSFLQGFFSQSTRPDGRLFSMCRPTMVTRGTLQKNTVGSSLVRMGNTQILCGVTLQIGVPSVPGCGDVSINLLPELQPILMEMLDLTCLSILEGQAAWRLQITLQVLQDDGNLWDASLIAAMAALQDTRLPATQRNASSGQMEIVELSSNDNDDDNKQEKLVFHYLAVPVTVGIYDHDEKTHFIADPTPQEATLLKGQLKMVVNDDNDIVYMQHSSSTVGLTRDDLAVAAHMTYGRAKEIRNLLLLE